MKKFLKMVALLSTALLFASNVLALDLQSAKSQGLVGEKNNGYLGSPNAQPSADVEHLIKDINKKRKSKYQEIAKKQGLALDAVEQLAGKKAFEKTESGHYIMVPGVGWKKK